MDKTRWLLCTALVFLAEPAAAKPSPQPATPLGNPGSWATNDDYPLSALREERAGTTRFLLNIDAAGVPTACTITQSSGSDDLDEATCNLVKMRARFNPARDRAGRATTGTYANAVRWVIPTDTVQVEPGVLVYSGVLGVDGIYRDCRVEKAEGGPGRGQNAGPLTCPTNRRGEPALDGDGKPVARRVRTTVTVEVLPP